MMIDYQQYLTPTDPDLVIYDVVDGRTAHLPALEHMITELMPQYVRYIPRMRMVAANRPDFELGAYHHQWVCQINGEYAAIIIFKHMIGRDCALGLDFAILPPFRRITFGTEQKRLAHLLLDLCLLQLEANAEKLGRPTPHGLLVEVEPPGTSLYDPQGKLLKQYRRYGIIELPVAYSEPPFIVDSADPAKTRDQLRDDEFYPMQLGLFPCHPQVTLTPAALTQLISAFLIDHYGMATNHWVVQRAFQSALPTPNPLP